MKVSKGDLFFFFRGSRFSGYTEKTHETHVSPSINQPTSISSEAQGQRIQRDKGERSGLQHAQKKTQEKEIPSWAQPRKEIAQKGIHASCPHLSVYLSLLEAMIQTLV